MSAEVGYSRLAWRAWKDGHGRGVRGHPSRRAPRALLRMRSECGALAPRMRVALKLRHLHLFGGDELQQRGLAFLRRLDAAPDRRDDIGGVLDALAIAAERLRELRVISR